MIAPCREYWWREVLPGEEDWRGPYINLNLVERIADKEEISPLAARYIVIGATKDGILSDGGPLYFEGVDHLDPQEVPEWLVFARNIERDGVTKLPVGEDTISIDASQLVQRASEKTHPHTDDLNFNQLVLHVHNSTGVELGVAKDRVESFIEDGVLERDGDTMALGSRGSPGNAKLG
ncbi:hypothetical protein [Haloarcula salina]|uniref:Uncharacterized protein n=1 Tax=Haloarcula salina TaxID=1429914 RepID=A0AA41KH64_9EURY|nr:hypothetical protein [Haloarcula salina]MBV0901406.1 hypothetical protein [Haloarcula salina]